MEKGAHITQGDKTNNALNAESCKTCKVLKTVTHWVDWGGCWASLVELRIIGSSSDADFNGLYLCCTVCW